MPEQNEFPRIASEGDRMDGPSEATATDRLEEIAETLEGDLIVAQSKLGELKGSSQKAVLAVEQVGSLLDMAGKALDILIPILGDQFTKAKEEGDLGLAAVIETPFVNFSKLREALTNEVKGMGTARSLLGLIEGRLG